MEKSDELLIIDDCSQIPVTETLAEIKDNRIRIYRNNSNLGVAASLNILLKICRFDLIARMDADDIMIPFRLTKQEHFLSKNPNHGAVFTSAINFGNRIRFFYPINFKNIDSETFPRKLLLGNPVVHSSTLLRRSNINLDEIYRETVAEDYDLWMRLASRAVRMAKIMVPGILYRKHNLQVTRKKSWIQKLKNDPLLEESHTSLARSLGWDSGTVWREMVKYWFDSDTSTEITSFIKFAKNSRI